MTRAPNFWAISTVRSVEPLSTTTIWSQNATDASAAGSRSSSSFVIRQAVIVSGKRAEYERRSGQGHCYGRRS